MADGQFPGLPQIMDKNFWQRTEGKFGVTGLVILAALTAVGAIMYLPAVMGYIALLAANTLSAVVHGVGAFALIYMILDGKIRNLVGFMYRSVIRKFTSLLVDLSPVAVVRDYIGELKKSLGKIEVQILNVKKAITSLRQIIERNKAEREQSLKRLSVAKKQGRNLEGSSETFMVGRLGQSIERMEKLAAKLELVYRALSKIKETAAIKVDITERDVDLTIRETAAMMSAQVAAEEAIKVINGDPNKKAMFDEAMGNLAFRTASAIATIDNFMEGSKSIFNSIDLEKGVVTEDALKQLDVWEKQLADDTTIFGPGESRQLIDAANDPNDVLDMNKAPAPLKHGGTDMSDYFK